MRIGIEVTAAIRQRAGIGRYTRELVRELVQIDTDSRILMAATASRDEIDELQRELPPGAWREIQPIPVPDRIMTAAWHRLRVPIRFERFTGPVDVLHGPDFVAPPSRAPQVITIHDLTFRTHPEFAEPALVSYLSTVVPRAISSAEAVIAVSASVAAEIAEAYPRARHKIVAIPNGVRLSECRLETTTIPNQRPTIVVVGTIEPRKNHLTLLASMSHIWKHFPDARLVIVGRQGWRAEAICSAIQRAESDGGVCWESNADDERLEQIFTGATLAAYPSVAEGFGLPALEAMARGIPTVLSDIPAHREVAGGSALYASPTDPEEFTDRILRLLSSDELRNDLADRGRSRAECFSWTETARRTRRVYGQVAGS